MVELCEVWERETLAVRHAAEMEVVARKLRHGRRWRRGLGWGLAASLLLATATGIGWATREHLLAGKVVRAEIEKNSAQKSEQGALMVRDEAQDFRQGAESALAEARIDIEELGRSRQMLLDWAFAEGGDGLPVLLNRKGRLELLDRQYKRLIRSESVSDVAWKKRWRTERALLALSRNEPEEARDFVGDEVSRLGGWGLTRLLLKESGEKEVSREDLALARTLVKRMSGYQEPWLQSALDLIEVRSLERNGQQNRALRLLSEIGSRVGELPSVEPGTISLWRTKVQREAAEVAEGAGRNELAMEFREQIVTDLRNELGADGLTDVVSLELSEQFVVAAEGLSEQLYSQGKIGEARSLAEEAIERVPESTEPQVQISLAVHKAVVGGCERERGSTEQAREQLEQGLALLEEPLGDKNLDRWRQYRRGMLMWQLSGILGQANEGEEEQAMGQKALGMMRELLEEGGLRPSPIQVHHVIGYLTSDLAQSYHSTEEKGTRDDLLDEAIESWKFLRAANPKEPEYVAGLAWCEKLREN